MKGEYQNRKLKSSSTVFPNAGCEVISNAECIILFAV